ncbi:MAG: fatty acid desaturase [Lautropia sp.]
MSSLAVSASDRRRYGRQNLAILAAQMLAWFALIDALHRPLPLALKAVLLLVFVLVMQGVFSLMHDCIHGNGHPSPALDRLIGVLSATVFGTTYTLFRVNHEGHHLRNRTRAEVAEYFYADDHRAWKTFKYYAAILGGIWLASFLAVFVLPLVPYARVRAKARAIDASSGSMNGYTLSFNQYSAQDWREQRLECAFAIAFWLAVATFAGWRIEVLAVAYAAFGFSWSSLQWIYHMRTPLDPVEGAYNLRAPWPVRALMLNFNYNLSHHRHPGAPWQRLHALTDLAQTQPILARYLAVFRPPEPMPADPASIRKVYF